MQDLIDALKPDERAALVALWAEELARGWIPKRSDLEAALHVVRSQLP
jgi:hypothetical protein